MEDSQRETISLVIKTPNQAQGDQTVEGVSLTWTVKDLKMHLSNIYPNKPTVSDQRLIYAGKLLLDHQNIKEIFRQTEPIPTLHLVCAIRTPPQGPLGARPKTKATVQPQASSPTPASSSPVQTPSMPELRQRRPTSAAPAQTPPSPAGPPTWPPAAVPGAPQMTQPAFPNYSLYSPQQLLWLQHVYARQYYMQYQAALAAAGTVHSTPAGTVGQYPPVPAHQVAVPAPLANQNPINEHLPANQNHRPAQDGAFINPGEANQNMRVNAQGGPLVEDEDDMERDWLDWLYTTARLGVLLMIVYFNSNLSRLLLVMSTLLLMYLHTAGWFPFRRQAQAQGPNHLQPPEAVQQNRLPNQDPADDVADRPREEAGSEASEGPGPMEAVLVPPHRVSAMWTAWVFFKTFFSSLIPEVPQGMAN